MVRGKNSLGGRRVNQFLKQVAHLKGPPNSCLALPVGVGRLLGVVDKEFE